jgi:type IV pilus assembly protein PilA
MLSMLRKRLDRDDEGFTLIELMVVVLIIAILIAIAIPTFLGAQDRARDRSAQSDLRNALTAAKTVAVDSAGLFQVAGVDMTAANLASAEPALTFSAGTASASATAIGVAVAAGGTNVLLVKQSASSKYFGVMATSGGAVTYCSSTTNNITTGNCTGSKW